jgi:DNA-binding transcriptional regulator LsrR (DeoR family)
VEPIGGVLRGGYLKTLVTDEPTASAVLDLAATESEVKE